MTQTKQTTGTGGGFPTRFLTPHIEGIPEAVQPFVQIGTKMQSEWLTLVGRRAEAWLDWPERLCKCSTANDVAEAQTAFLETMQHDYAAWLDGILRDTMIEQEELDEETPEAKAAEETAPNEAPPHREAA
jgi:hypothetical protein